MQKFFCNFAPVIDTTLNISNIEVSEVTKIGTKKDSETMKKQVIMVPYGAKQKIADSLSTDRMAVTRALNCADMGSAGARRIRAAALAEFGGKVISIEI